MPQRFPWDEDEAIILLDALLQVLSGARSRKDAIIEVSNTLRERAIRRGFAINDTFRNLNGIQWQMSFMERAYGEVKQDWEHHKIPKLFQSVVSMHKTNPAIYERRLAEAKAMIEPTKTVQECFFEWLVEEIPSEQASELYSVLRSVCDDVERFCMQEGFLTKPLFETTDLDLVKYVLSVAESNEKFHFTDEHVISKPYSVLSLYYEFLDEQNTDRQFAEPQAQFNAELLSAAETIISSNFVNGVRKNSAIAKRKFRSAYLALTGKELLESVNIDELVSAVGYEYADKYYAVSEADKQKIRELISTAVDEGNRVIFYAEVYQRNLEFMTRAGIFSADLLKVILKRILPNMRYKYAYFSPADNDSLEQDIINCFGSERMRTYEEMKEHLPYADLDQIRLVCSRSNKLVWAKEGTYALTDRIQFSQSDIDASMDTVSRDIENQGFSVLQRISILESAELNPYVPEVAVREALYIKYLGPLYERKRSIITLPGASFHAPMVVAEYCKGLQEITLSELQSYEERLTDKSVYSLSAAYDVMIRVDQERFVSADAINFDIHAIDEALSLFVQDKIVPLASVKSFTSFPEVDGFTWNLFLLDSFCRHKSMRFRSMGGPAKSKPVGAIFPIQMHFDSYDDLLARVAAESNLNLHIDDIGDFLKRYAYTLRRIDTSKIVAGAQEIRIQEGIADV